MSLFGERQPFGNFLNVENSERDEMRSLKLTQNHKKVSHEINLEIPTSDRVKQQFSIGSPKKDNLRKDNAGPYERSSKKMATQSSHSSPSK
jgi:hypothetical protein